MDPLTAKEAIVFIAGAIVGGLFSWLITHRYFVKSGHAQSAALKALAAVLQTGNTLERFEAHLRSSSWSKHYIENREVWTCDSDNTFQITQGDRERDFREPWTENLPDPNASVYPVYLRIGSATIKQLHFISADGARIFVVMPEIGFSDRGERQLFWNINSIGVLVTNIVGDFYIYQTLAGFAARSHIEIIE